jgi:hypothetical protein
VTDVVSTIRDQSPYADKYIFVPFNEPDGSNWYGGNWTSTPTGWSKNRRDQFLEDWDACYNAIKAAMPTAKIAGPGHVDYLATQSRDILTHARDAGTLPDIFTFHELEIDDLTNFRAEYAAYRTLEAQLGIDPIPVNITEYARRRDMGAAGLLVQWLAMFEEAKVDAQTAYWTYAGNLNDNQSKNNDANSGWWLFKWYGDMTGDSVRVTPPSSNVNASDRLQGLATLDTSKPQGTLLYGGSQQTDVRVSLTGLDQATFGDTVDIQVREARFSGQEGEAPNPPVVLSARIELTDDPIEIVVPNESRLNGYQVIVTPALASQPEVDTRWHAAIEAENTALTDVTAYNQSLTSGSGMTPAASNQRDVGSTNKVSSALTWNVDIPKSGRYRYDVLAGINSPEQGAGRHAVFVDGQLEAIIQYEPGFAWTYRGIGSAYLDLTAGSHSISLRMSADGATLLPGSDISVDRLDLWDASEPESDQYPANLARLSAGAEILYASPGTAGFVALSGTETATFYVAAHDTGYYDLGINYLTQGAATLAVSVNKRPITGLGTAATGTWKSTARVHLAKGISRIDVGSTEGIALGSIETVRAAAADSAVFAVQAEDSRYVTTSGAVTVDTIAEPTNAQGGQALGSIGDGGANYITLDRPAGFVAGQYNLVVAYSNAAKNTGHAYNTDVISRFLDITEIGGTETTRGSFRHNYSWKGFWWHTVALDLTTDSGDINLGNETGAAPLVDALQLAPLVVSARTTRTAAIADVSALAALVAEAVELVQDDYTSATWATLAEAVVGAQAVLDDFDSDQEAVDDAVEALAAAIDGLLFDLPISVSYKCVAKKVVLTAKATNTTGAAVKLAVSSQYGSSSFASVSAGASASVALTTRLAAVGDVVVTVDATGPDGPTGHGEALFAGAVC